MSWFVCVLMPFPKSAKNLSMIWDCGICSAYTRFFQWLKTGNTVKPVWNSHSRKYQNLAFKNNFRLMQVKSIAECSKGSILQYFRPSLGYHLSLRSLFCLFLSGFIHRFYCKHKHIGMYTFTTNFKQWPSIHSIHLSSIKAFCGSIVCSECWSSRLHHSATGRHRFHEGIVTWHVRWQTRIYILGSFGILTIPYLNSLQSILFLLRI